jgi:predicted nucleotidyltransferase
MVDNEFAAYMPGIRRRWMEEQESWQLRREQAWASARRAADVLRQSGATRVHAFGSLTRAGIFDARSDIDLAEEGIPVSKFWRASADADAATGDFELDIVDLADCQPELRQVILREGVVL